MDQTESRVFDAAALVVDVSGFTALTADLEAAHGRGAADRLSMVMDDLLGTLAEIVLAAGGTVVDVVGDSVQAIWPSGTAHSNEEGVQGAVRAANAMAAHTAEISRAAPVGRDLRLNIRIGIAYGPLTVARVGGHDEQWDELVWGPALFDAAQTTAHAPVGSAGLHETARRLVDSRFSCTNHDGVWVLDAGASSDGQSPIPETTADHRHEGAHWAAELRSVTIMFALLFRADEAVRARPEHVQRRVRLLQETIALHGGVLDKVHADEKGISAVVAFGLPPAPVGEAAVRALAAALDLRAGLRDLGIEVAIGLATGRVRVGLGSRSARTGHTIYGGAANLAARCMQACRDEILADDATRRQAADAFEFLNPEAYALKGLGTDLKIFGLGNARRRAGRGAAADATPMAGRNAEIARLKDFVSADTGPRMLLLHGEVGIGKSRLMDAALAFAREQSVDVLFTRAGPLGSRTPLFAWREPAAGLLRNWAREHNRSLGEAQAALLQNAGEDAALAPLTNPLFGLELSDAAANALSDPQGRPRLARRLQAMVLAQLIGNAKSLLAIEDAHWLDEASALLAVDLLALLPRMRLLLAGRAPLRVAQDAFADALGPDSFTTMVVGPLDSDGIAALVGSLIAPVHANHPLIPWLQGRARGNPLFTCELLRTLPKETLRTGLVSPGAWREAEAEIHTLDLPQTIEDAAVTLLDALPISSLGVLKAASVLGGSFDSASLAALEVPIAADDLERILGDLVAAGLLIAEAEGGRSRWRFAQDLVRETVYRSLPDRMRLALHRKAVESLESLPPQQAGAFSAQIAYHWQEAGEPVRALKPLRRAGIAAHNAGAYADAIGFFQSAIAIAQREAAAKPRLGSLGLVRLNLDLCNAYFVVGDHHKAMAPGLSCLTGLGRNQPKSTFGWMRMVAQETLLLWSTVKFPSFWQSERRSAVARARNRLRCEVAARLSDCHYFLTGKVLPSLAFSLFGARAAERAGDLSVAAPPYGFVGYASGLMHLKRISQFCIERTVPACTRAKNMFGLQRAYGGKLLLAISLGDWKTARPLLDGSLAFRTAYRSDVNHGMALSLQAQFHRMTGDMSAARRGFEALGTLGRTISDDQFVGWSHLGFSRVALCDNDTVTVECEAEKGLAVLGRTIEVQALFMLEALRAVAILRQERYEEAAAMSESLVARAETTPLQFASGEAFGAVAETMNGLLAYHGDSAGNRRRAQRAMKRMRQFARVFPIGAPVLALHEGQLAALLGHRRKAERLWQRGLKSAEAMPMPYEAARLHAALADLPSLENELREQHRRRTAELMTSCGLHETPTLQLSIRATSGE